MGVSPFIVLVPGWQTAEPRSRKGVLGVLIFRERGRALSWHVVFTVSAQFGVPVPYIWALTRGITSYAGEIVASLAEVERRPAAFLAQLAPVAHSQRSRAGDKGSALGVISGR